MMTPNNTAANGPSTPLATNQSTVAGPSTAADRSPFASRSPAVHLARGAAGFGLIGVGFGLSAIVGPATLLLVIPGMVALRGCPMCWIVGLVETVSAGRLRRDCTESGRCAVGVPPRR
jgi:hypothetical protein